MSAPRIDSVRKTIGRAVQRLQFVADQLDDLHVLAYNRSRARTEKVRGGWPDYSLDTHGLPEARRLYAQVAEDVDRLLTGCLASSDDLRDFLNNVRGAPHGRRDPLADATADEKVEALDNQRVRRQRGEYTPARLVPQPEIVSQTDWRAECMALRSAVAKVTDAFARDHADCRLDPDPASGKPRRPRRRYQLALLTPREREAWNRSVRVDDAEKAS